ncbi:MAG: hypothetical protein FWD61_15025 [Phycisphaerales bacterium]|nr:hypothetical protein [Phycisphaerales bacterium]
MPKQLAHLGPYSDLPACAIRANKLWPRVVPGIAASRRFLKALHFQPRQATPLKLRVDKRWQRDGICGEALSWSVGYGPRTEAWLLKPAGAKGKLPGVLVLHDHGAYKFYGKEKIADGPDPAPPVMTPYREEYYGKLAIANTLAKRGYIVLVHDTFAWGSRKFPYETMMCGSNPMMRIMAEHTVGDPGGGDDMTIKRYNSVAMQYENILEKYAHVLGATFAGIVNFEDRIAANVLASRSDVQTVGGGIACMGLSGGGMRSVLLNATLPSIKAAVVVGAMTTYPGLLDAHIVNHTWMLYPPAFAALGDWPDVVACRAPTPLMVQYCEKDGLYTLAAQRAAHRHIASVYHSTKSPKNYRGLFYDAPHQFNLDMQQDAFAFLDANMR